MEEELFINSSTYLESLCRAYKSLVDAGLKKGHKVENLFEEVIELELELAIMGSKKAKERVSKSSAKIEEIKR